MSICRLRVSFTEKFMEARDVANSPPVGACHLRDTDSAAGTHVLPVKRLKEENSKSYQ